MNKLNLNIANTDIFGNISAIQSGYYYPWNLGAVKYLYVNTISEETFYFNYNGDLNGVGIDMPQSLSFFDVNKNLIFNEDISFINTDLENLAANISMYDSNGSKIMSVVSSVSMNISFETQTINLNSSTLEFYDANNYLDYKIILNYNRVLTSLPANLNLPSLVKNIQVYDSSENLIATLDKYGNVVSGSIASLTDYADALYNDNFSSDKISSSSIVMNYYQHNLTLAGASNINGTGNSYDNLITGNNGYNVLNGGVGADTLIGGLGNDTYYVDDTRDIVTELANQGADTLVSSISYTLGDNLENLTLIGTDDINATGNLLSNVIIGNSGNNILYGGKDGSVLTSEKLVQKSLDFSGNIYCLAQYNYAYTYTYDDNGNVSSKAVIASYSLDADSNSGNGQRQQVYTYTYDDNGNLLNESLDGALLHSYTYDSSGKILTSSDLIGGVIEVSKYTYDSYGNILVKYTKNHSSNWVINVVHSYSYDSQENILSDNIIYSNNCNEIFTYAYDSSGKKLTENRKFYNENGRLIGNNSKTYTYNSSGDKLNEIYYDYSTENGLLDAKNTTTYTYSKPSTDILIGGFGDDTYYIDNTGDKITELANQGTDTVISSISYTLGANLENLTLTVSDNLNGTGNALKNLITGNRGNNVLNGGIGADTLTGGDGDDTYYVDNLGDIVNENLDEGTDIVFSSVSSELSDNIENLTLTGSIKSLGTGNSLNNIITGNFGIDTLTGKEGNDTYYVNNTTDIIIENADQGNDSVFSSVSYILSDDIENLTLTGLTSINGTGNSSNNIITGNNGYNVLNGGIGADTMTGGLGNDTYYVDNIGDVVSESLNQGIDLVISSIDYTLGNDLENLTLTGTDNVNATGNTYNNIIKGNSGNNILDGGIGADNLTGSLGNDTYCIDNIGDKITELYSQGIDSIISSISYTLGANLENLTLSGISNINAIGNSIDNIIIGNLGINTLIGGTGNDTYYVYNTADLIVENTNQGNDSVFSSVSYTLSNNIENLALTGITNINATGNTINNVIIGNEGDNILDGNIGSDTLTGGLGNDTYYIDNIGDIVNENQDAGADTVISSISYTLGDNFENLTLAGVGDFKGTGNSLDNIIIGNTGNDTLIGGNGNDTIIGGLGNDSLDGGAGDNTYIFNRGDSQDTINLNGIYSIYDFNNTLKFGEGITQDDIYITLNNQKITIGIKGTNDSIVLNGELPLIKQIIFSDGKILTSDKFWTLAIPNNEGTDGNDTISGNGIFSAYMINSDDTIYGKSGNDIINGFGGSDLIYGGSGNDTLSGDIQNGLLWLNPFPLIFPLIQGDDTIYGEAGNDYLYGGEGNDIIDGGVGADTLIGNNGNDTYYIDDVRDVVTEFSNQGIDTVFSSVSYTLGDNIENLTLTGSANIDCFGNDLDNIIIGNNGDNIFNGGYGNDTLIGCAGNDTYYIDNTNDTIIENENGGIDSVYSNVSYTLGDNLENLYITAGGNRGTGNSLNNFVAAYYYSNITLDGGAGNDNIRGNDYNDTLIGGTGNDYLEGVRGNDTYIFDDNFGLDTIYDPYELSTFDFSRVDLNHNLTFDLGSRFWGYDENNLIYLKNADPYVTGNVHIASLLLGAGDDKIIFGDNPGLSFDYYNVDTIDGGVGIDTLDFSIFTGSPGPLHVNLQIGYAYSNQLSDVPPVHTYILNFENIIGGSDDDLITGNNLNNILNGGSGNDDLIGGSGNDTYLFNLGNRQDIVNDSSGYLDEINFDSSVDKNKIAIFLSLNDLIIDYGTIAGNDKITIQNQNINTIEKFELSNGQFLTNTEINTIIQNMSSYASSHSLSFTSVNDVKNNQDLMAIIVNSWHN